MLLPILKASFQENADAANCLETRVTDPEDYNRYAMIFARSAQHTPHELRMRAEQKLTTALQDAHRANAAAPAGCLMPVTGSGPTATRPACRLPLRRCASSTSLTGPEPRQALSVTGYSDESGCVSAGRRRVMRLQVDFTAGATSSFNQLSSGGPYLR